MTRPAKSPACDGLFCLNFMDHREARQRGNFKNFCHLFAHFWQRLRTNLSLLPVPEIHLVQPGLRKAASVRGVDA
jgi:hypothetical protein